MTEKDIEWYIREAYEWDGTKYQAISGRIAKQASKSIFREHKLELEKAKKK